MDTEELSAIVEVNRTMSKYGHAWDTKDLGLLRSVLTEDCSIDYTVFGSLDGRAEVEAFAERYFAGETEFRDWFHVFSNPWIEIDDERARGRWHFLGVYTFDEVGATWQAGFYDIGFERADGDWKIDDLTLEYKYVTPYDAGWDEVPMAPELVE